MIGRMVLTSAAALVCAGCGAGRPPASAGDGRDVSQWKPARITHVQVAVEQLGEVPNNALQLPAPSPDGQWIAYLRLEGDEPLSPGDLLAGRNMARMSLYIRRLKPGAQERLVRPSGAAWPVWSPDSAELVFLAYSDAGRCDLAVYGLATGVTRRIGLGLGNMMMPAVSPDSKRVALTTAPPAPNEPRLHVVNLDTRQVIPCPGNEPQAAQIRPEWADNERIVYVLREGGRCRVMQWSPGKSQPETLAKVNMPSWPVAVYRSFAALGCPLSAGGGRFAYYDTAEDNIVLVNLRDGAGRALDAGTRSGCWLDEHQFVAATDKEMLLFDRDYPPTCIIRQPSLPLGADKDGRIILCQPGKTRRSFALSRITATFVR